MYNLHNYCTVTLIYGAENKKSVDTTFKIGLHKGVDDAIKVS